MKLIVWHSGKHRPSLLVHINTIWSPFPEIQTPNPTLTFSDLTRPPKFLLSPHLAFPFMPFMKPSKTQPPVEVVSVATLKVTLWVILELRIFFPLKGPGTLRRAIMDSHKLLYVSVVPFAAWEMHLSPSNDIR